MFDIGWPELMVVAIILIIVVGPKDLPKMLRSFAKMVKKLRAMAGEFRGQFDEALKESDLGDVQDVLNSAKSLNPKNVIADALNPLKKVGQEMKSDLDAAMRDDPKTKNDTDEDADLDWLGDYNDDAKKVTQPKATAKKTTPKKAVTKKPVVKAAAKKPAVKKVVASKAATSSAKPRRAASKAKPKTAGSNVDKGTPS